MRRPLRRLLGHFPTVLAGIAQVGLYLDAMRPPSSLDAALFRVIQEELSRYGDAAATVRREWSDGAGMWFVQVDPVEAEAARISAGFDGDGDLSVTVGHTWFEMFPFDESSLDEFRLIVRAVLAGYIEEAGGKREAAGTARIYTERGPRSVGAAVRWPWRLRFHRRYKPYAGSFVGSVEALLYRHDPIGINFGDNPDEYQPEAESIAARLPQCRSVEDVRVLVHEEFVRWFDTDIAGPVTRYDQIARELWVAWQATGKTPWMGRSGTGSRQSALHRRGEGPRPRAVVRSPRNDLRCRDAVV